MQHILRERVVSLPELTQYIAVYRLVESLAKLEDSPYRTFGFCVDLANRQTDAVEEQAAIWDVTSNAETANKWFALLWQGLVLPSTLQEVVENLIAD